MIKFKNLFLLVTICIIFVLIPYSSVKANIHEKILNDETIIRNEVLDVIQKDTVSSPYSVLNNTETEGDFAVYSVSKMYAKDNVNIRNKNNKKSKIIGVLNFRESIYVRSYNSEKSWQEVEHNGHIGYIKSSYLSFKKPKNKVKNITIPELSNAQRQRAYTIANICIKEWDKYGVLPSVAIAQAMIESTLGEHCSGYNLWGIASGKVRYSSLSDGVYGYLRVINNGCYGTAPFTKTASDQIRKILNGGYCVPVGNYYNDAMWIINHYKLRKFDKLIKYQL